MREFLEPLAARRIIVRPGIDDGVIHKVLRKMRIVLAPIEGELENPGAWNPELVAKDFNIPSDKTQILGNERQSA